MRRVTGHLTTECHSGTVLSATTLAIDGPIRITNSTQIATESNIRLVNQISHSCWCFSVNSPSLILGLVLVSNGKIKRGEITDKYGPRVDSNCQ